LPPPGTVRHLPGCEDDTHTIMNGPGRLGLVSIAPMKWAPPISLPKGCHADGGRLVIGDGQRKATRKNTVKPNPCLPRGKESCSGVSDTGHGMDKATSSKIFEPFFSTRLRQRNGARLSMVHGIIKNHDGRITCRSTPGKGACLSNPFTGSRTCPGEKAGDETRGCHRSQGFGRPAGPHRLQAWQWDKKSQSTAFRNEKAVCGASTPQTQ